MEDYKDMLDDLEAYIWGNINYPDPINSLDRTTLEAVQAWIKTEKADRGLT